MWLIVKGKVSQINAKVNGNHINFKMVFLFRHKNIVAEIYRLEQDRQRKQSRGSLTSLSINLNKYSVSY